jgi:SAM-dependent methyltransferase
VDEFPLRDVPDRSFDVVYGTGILHHFSDLRGACEEVRRLLRPGGYAVFAETLNTDPLIRCARRLTRRFKSDQDWEFPFDREALRTIKDVFPNTEMFFFDGFTHLAVWAPVLGKRFLRAATRFTNALEERFQRRGGRLASMCWLVNLLLRSDTAGSLNGGRSGERKHPPKR